MNKQVLKGFNYVATSASGATITDSNGIVLCEVQAGKQGYFVATTDVIDCGTEDVSIVEIRGNFNVPSAGNGGGVDPTPYIEEIERLEEEIAELEAALSPNSVLAISDAGSVKPFFSMVPNGVSFAYNSDITSWSYQLTDLIYANVSTEYGEKVGMFQGCSFMETFTAALPDTLQDASYMFYDCSTLSSFSAPSGSLPNSIRTADFMFYRCSSLNSWTIEFPGLTSSQYMFAGCTGLTSFSTPSGSLHGINNAYGMFSGCTALTSFSAALPSNLSTASDMFYNCKLNKASVQNIVNTIPYFSSGTHRISIGVDSTSITQTEQENFNAQLVQKGWTVTWQRR